MGRRVPREASLRDYVAEVLKKATYEKGEVLDVIVAEAPDLPGCFTQGSSFEEARENLIDAIEPKVTDPGFSTSVSFRTCHCMQCPKAR